MVLELDRSVEAQGWAGAEAWGLVAAEGARQGRQCGQYLKDSLAETQMIG